MTFFEWIVLVLLIYIAASVGGDLALKFLGRSLRIAFVLIILASFASVIFVVPSQSYLGVKLFAAFLAAIWFLNRILSYLRSANSQPAEPKSQDLAGPDQRSALQESLRAWLAGRAD
jgi:hypothetical protein